MTSTPTERWIYKILPRVEWEKAEKAGNFEGCGIDLQDGFIHFSTATQAVGTASKYFAGVSGLMLVAVDTTKLDSENLKWETSRDGDLFPHLYAPLAIAAVEWAKDLPVGGDGKHEFPEFL